MNFYTQQHKHYCGIDLHAKAMYVCILDQQWHETGPQKSADDPRSIFTPHCSVSRRSGRRRRMYVHVVLAGGPLSARKGLPLSWAMPSI